jgi:hypothetical protein
MDSLYFTGVLDFGTRLKDRVKKNTPWYSWKNIRIFYITFGTTRLATHWDSRSL